MSAGHVMLALRSPDAARLRDLLRQDDRAEHAYTRPTTAPPRWFRVVDTAPIGGASYRWAYTLQEGVWNQATLAVVDRAGTATVTGYNLAEAGNTASVAGGIEVDTLPDGWDVYPVGVTKSGTLTGAYFNAWPCWTDDGVVWLFSEANPIDGECA